MATWPPQSWEWWTLSLNLAWAFSFISCSRWVALPRNLDHLASTSSLLICTLYICELKEENSKENQHPLLLVSNTKWSDDKSYTFGLLSFTFIFACSSSSPRVVNYRVLSFSTSQSAITVGSLSQILGLTDFMTGFSHISSGNFRLGVSTWMSSRHVKLNMSNWIPLAYPQNI